MSPLRLPTLLLAALLLAAPAAPAARDGDKEVQTLLTKGHGLLKADKARDALPVLQRALTLAESAHGRDHVTTGLVCYWLGHTHKALGKNGDAESFFLRSLSINEARPGKDHLSIASDCGSLGELYRNTARYDKAELHFRRALAIREKAHGKDHVDVGISLNDLGNVCLATNRYAEAEGYYRRCRQIWTAKLGENHADVLMVMSNQGLLYREMRKFAEAEQLFKQVLARREAVPGKNNNLDVAATLNHLAWLYVTTGKYDKAEPFFQRALAIRQSVQGTEHRDVALVHNSLGTMYLRMRQYGRAEGHYVRSLKMTEARVGLDHPETANCVHNLAWLYQSKGQYSRAEEYYVRSLKMTEARVGRNDPETASCVHDLAWLYQSMGQYARAEPMFLEAKAVREAKLGKNHLDVASSLNGLGVLYDKLGRYAKAEPLFLRCLAIREEKLGKDHADVGFVLTSLGGMYVNTRQFEKAEQSYKRSLAISEATMGKDHPETATCLHNLAWLYQTMGLPEKAEVTYKSALAIYQTSVGRNHPSYAQSLNNLGNLYLDMGEYAKAEPLHRRSLAIREERLGEDHPNVGQSLNNMGRLLEALNKSDGASRHFDRARRGNRRHVSLVLPSLPVAEQAAYLAEQESWGAYMAYSQGLRHGNEDALAARSASWLLNGKAVAEESMARSALLLRDSNDPAAKKLAAMLRDLRTNLARLSLVAPAAGEEAAHRKEVATLSAREQSLARQLAAVGGASAGAASWIELEEMRRQLPADSVFIDVVRFDVWDYKTGKGWLPPHYGAWVTPARGPVRVVDLGEAAKIDAAVKEVRQALEDAAKNNGALFAKIGDPAAEKVLLEPLEKLSKLVMRPLLPHAGKAKQWVVSPDSNLWLVPWEILLLPDGKYAVEKHAFRYVVSGRDLFPAAPFAGTVTRPTVVADPDFDLDAATVRTETQRLGRERNGDEELRGVSSLLRLGAVKRLPGTRKEAVAIDKLLTDYTKQPPRKYLGKFALEGRVKRVANPRLLVLATHGFFLQPRQYKPAGGVSGGDKAPPGWENPLLRCGLLMAGCNKLKGVTDADDGVLTGLEVASMDLRGCEMVVLSACETGLGDVQNGEGVAGLRQAFRLAGAESVVSTLWQVPDRSSARLMTLFFANLAKGKSRPDALREAQLKLIAERRDDYAAAHPLFWAAFTVTGR